MKLKKKKKTHEERKKHIGGYQMQESWWEKVDRGVLKVQISSYKINKFRENNSKFSSQEKIIII